MSGTIAETVEGARTIDALGLASRQMGRVDEDLVEAYDAEMYTLSLRLRWFPSVEFAYALAGTASCCGADGSRSTADQPRGRRRP